MAKQKKETSQEPEVKPEEVEEVQKIEMDTLAVTATIISEKGEPVEPDESVIKFKVTYSKGYNGKRHWEDGSIIETSKESALQFEQMGLGKCL